MLLVNHIGCPNCNSRIELSGEPIDLFDCHVCGCQFRRDHRRWTIAIPAAILFTAMIGGCLNAFGVHNVGTILAAIAGGSGAMAGSSFQGFIIVTAGREFPVGVQPDPPANEVHWLISTALVLISVILIILTMVWSEAAKQPPI